MLLLRSSWWSSIPTICARRMTCSENKHSYLLKSQIFKLGKSRESFGSYCCQHVACQVPRNKSRYKRISHLFDKHNDSKHILQFGQRFESCQSLASNGCELIVGQDAVVGCESFKRKMSMETKYCSRVLKLPRKENAPFSTELIWFPLKSLI